MDRKVNYRFGSNKLYPYLFGIAIEIPQLENKLRQITIILLSVLFTDDT